MGLYIGNEKIGGGLITQVNALPEANATNYAKNQLYLYENKLYFIVLDGSTYKYKKLGQDTPSYQVTFTASGNWTLSSQGIIQIYDGQDNTGIELLNQLPANKSVFPMTLEVTSGYCYIKVRGSYVMYYNGITSSDYTLTGQDALEKVATIDKDGTINIEVINFDG